MSQMMSANSQVYLDLKRTPRISNSKKMDKDLIELIEFVEAYKSSWLYKVVKRMKRR